MSKRHQYSVQLTWEGNKGTGTSGYRDYSRAHTLAREGKQDIQGSSDPGFRGDPSRWNPEELLVASLAACHQLWYLHLCAEAGVVVVGYEDSATGEMEESASGGGRFTRVTLHPRVSLAPNADMETAQRLHEEAHTKCFIANSVTFPVLCAPVFCFQTPTLSDADPRDLYHGLLHRNGDADPRPN